MPNLVEELKKIPAFTGHLSYRHEHSGDKEWVYSVGVNNTTVDIITGVDHNQWTDSEVQEFVDRVREASYYHAPAHTQHVHAEVSDEVLSLDKPVDRPVDDEVGETPVDEGNQATT